MDSINGTGEELFQYMIQSLGDNRSYMRISKRIKNSFTIPAGLYQMFFFQNTKLVGNGTLSHGKTVSYITDAQFTIRKGIQDTESGRIPEYLKKISQLIQVVRTDLRNMKIYMMMVLTAHLSFHNLMFHSTSIEFNYDFSIACEKNFFNKIPESGEVYMNHL